MGKIYILLQYTGGNWHGCYSFGCFTNRKKALEQIDKLNRESGTIEYTIQTICKNEL